VPGRDRGVRDRCCYHAAARKIGPLSGQLVVLASGTERAGVISLALAVVLQLVGASMAVSTYSGMPETLKFANNWHHPTGRRKNGSRLASYCT